MALQTSIAQYFNTRKRGAVDDLKRSQNNKVLILDKNNVESSAKDLLQPQSVEQEGLLSTKAIFYDNNPKNKIIRFRKPDSQPLPKKTLSKRKKNPTKLLSGATITEKTADSGPKKQLDIRQTLQLSSSSVNDPTAKSETEEELVNVTFEVRGLSPKKKISPKKSWNPSKVPTVEEVAKSKDSESSTRKSSEIPDVAKTDNVESSKLGDAALKPIIKDLSLSQLKAKIAGSSRLTVLKDKIKKFQEGNEKLNKILNKSPDAKLKSPSLNRFNRIEVEVPVSPAKSIMDEHKVAGSPSLLRKATFFSPKKTSAPPDPYISPRKLFTSPTKTGTSPSKASTNVPAFERYYGLVCSGKSTLVLPYKYRCLAEMFRCLDAVVSLIYNRNETVHYDKVKTSVDKLIKLRPFSECALGQIIAVMPEAYTLTREKIRILGSSKENYELVIDPAITEGPLDPKSGKRLLTPSLLLERRRKFFNLLLDRVKDVHHEFLISLDPPLRIPKDKVSRWHPDFNIDESSPDIIGSPMPECPNEEKYSTAKEVLDKARNLFGVNSRMEKALELITDKEESKNRENENNVPTTSCPIPELAQALKNIPKSLLEKVRARQAAKAAALITRCPQETKKRMELTRLPELSRILRNIFVLEKKNVLLKSLVLNKLVESYRESLNIDEMNHHLNLIMENVPGWISSIQYDGKNYLKVLRSADFNRVQSKLQDLIAHKQINL